jgi:DNA uptake protein ComE-like DNA-binding protein
VRPTYWRAEALAGAALVTVGLVVVGLSARALVRGDAPPALDARPARLDVNTASAEALALLPGIGPRTAARVIGGRPYRAVEELRPVLGDALFEAARPFLTLAPTAVAPVSSR